MNLMERRMLVFGGSVACLSDAAADAEQAPVKMTGRALGNESRLLTGSPVPCRQIAAT
jgi:hypothetical protein